MFEDPLVRWLIYLMIGGLLLLAVFRLPEKAILWIGRYLSPNWVSIIHTPLALIGYFLLYRQDYLFFGLELIIFAAALDRLDGRMSTVLSHYNTEPVPKNLWGQLNYKGRTPYGKLIDPLMDKFAVLPIFLDAGFRFLFGLEKTDEFWLIWLLAMGAILIAFMMLVEFIGQMMRLDYFSKWRRKKDNSATWAGKIKALAQWIWLIFFPIWDKGWLDDEYRGGFIAFLNVFLMVIVGLAVLSVVSRMRPVKDTWTKAFGHRVRGE